jgi:hypothetical protein
MMNWKNWKKKQQKFDVKYIVVHKTGTKPGVVLKELDKLPYHYVITKAGKLLNLKPLKAMDSTIEIALSGGMDRHGNHIDGRTEEQNETLFNSLVMLVEAFPDAMIVGADELYVYGFSNPGFDIKSWLHSYIPAVFFA